MRLLNTNTLVLEEFIGSDLPAYAILSHTWGIDEVSLQAYPAQATTIPAQRGYAKILHTCRLAREQSLGYAWVDTCCIDKTSSTELSEAINSMFQWYKQAAVCYAYLSDMPPASENHSPSHDLSRCRWFRRGWTLQELLAPRDVVFLDQEWTIRGTKASFEKDISQLTHINPKVLRDSAEIRKQPVFVRMSWAASRETTRIEDTAYCLLGIFDVNMPLLYGERHKAFTRLQHEIIKQSSDLSIFGWSSHSGDFNFPHDNRNLRLGSYGILAPSPKVFTASWGSEDGVKAVEFSLTNMGIKINGGLLILCAGACPPSSDCSCPADSRKYFLSVQDDVRNGRFWGVFLEKLKPDLFVRSSPHLIHPAEATMSSARPKASRPIYIATNGPYPRRCELFVPQAGDPEQQNYSIVAAAPQSRWHHCERGFFKEGVPKNQLWGLLSVKMSCRGYDFHTFVLIRYQDQELVHILHHLNDNRREISMTMRDLSGWDWDDVQFIFENELSSREGDRKTHTSDINVKGTTLRVVASIGDRLTIQVAEL